MPPSITIGLDYPSWFGTLGGIDRELSISMDIHRDLIYITGFTNATEKGDYDAFISCLSPDGTVQWFKIIEGPDDELTYCIDVYEESIYISGVVIIKSRNSVRKAFISRLTLDGTLEWYKTIEEGYSSNSITDISVYQETIYITGITHVFGPSNTFITSINTDGTFLWSKTITRKDRNDYATEIAVYEGNIYITGTIEDTDRERRNVYVASLSPDGSIQWMKTIKDSQGNNVEVISDHSNSIAVSANNIYIAGSTRIYEPDINTKVFIVSLSHEGSLRWSKIFKIKDFKFISKIVAVYGENIIITGTYWSSPSAASYFSVCYTSDGYDLGIKIPEETKPDSPNDLNVRMERYMSPTNSFSISLKDLVNTTAIEASQTSNESTIMIYVHINQAYKNLILGSIETYPSNMEEERYTDEFGFIKIYFKKDTSGSSVDDLSVSFIVDSP
jgi:hypothetical protein